MLMVMLVLVMMHDDVDGVIVIDWMLLVMMMLVLMLALVMVLALLVAKVMVRVSHANDIDES